MAEETNKTRQGGSGFGLEMRKGKVARLGSTTRIQDMNELFHNHRPSAEIHRARVYTRVYKETEGEPELQRRYKAIAETIRTLEPVIYPCEKLIGWNTKQLRSNQIAIECHAHWMAPDLDAVRTRPYDPFEISDEDIEELRREIIPYWKDKTITAYAYKILPEGTEALHTTGGVLDHSNVIQANGAHFIADYDDFLKNGMKARYALCEQKLAELDHWDPDYAEKRIFYTGMLDVIQATRDYCENYAKEAERLAAETDDKQWAARLHEMAACIRWVSWEAPRTFYEALEMMWLSMVWLFLEGSGTSITFGRMDQYLYPFYKKDVDEGRLTPESAMELIEELYIRATQHVDYKSSVAAEIFGGYYRYEHLDVGGITRDGRDASNELSYLLLRAMRHVKTTGPSVCLLLHSKTPDSLLQEAVELSAEGMGHPSFFNVETLHRALMNKVVRANLPFTIEDIRERGCAIGCTEYGIAGCQAGQIDSSVINIAVMTTFAVTNGYMPDYAHNTSAGTYFSIQTGKAEDIKSYEQYEEAVLAHLKHNIGELYRDDLVGEKVIMDRFPLALFTLYTKGAVEKAKDVTAGGAIISAGPTIACVGFADMVNSMAAVKKVIFDDKKYTMTDLEQALLKNFEGYEDLRLALRAAPKWGNDDDYVDNIATKVWRFYGENTSNLRNARGQYMDGIVQMVQANVGMGNNTPALPNGRFSATPLADCMSAEQHTDVNGPTAAARSYGKIDYAKMGYGSTLNMWITRNELVEPYDVTAAN